MLPVELSDDERRRFLRALCRLQTHSNISASPEKSSGTGCCFKFRNDWDRGESRLLACEEAYRVFYGTLPTWEYDEMGCVWTYLKTKFCPAYNVVSDSVRDLIEKHGNADRRFHDHLEHLELPWDQIPPWFNINSLRDLEDLPHRSNALAALGPLFLYRLLHAEPFLQRDMVLRNASSYGETFIGRVGMGVTEDEMIPQIYPADRHAHQRFRPILEYIAASQKTEPSVEECVLDGSHSRRKLRRRGGFDGRPRDRVGLENRHMG